MSKVKIPLLLLFVSGQLAGCSIAQNYLYSTLSLSAPISLAAPTFEYDLLEPRRSHLPLATTTKLNDISHGQDRFTYYSASGYLCYTLSLNPLSSACNIDGQWISSAPILSN